MKKLVLLFLLLGLIAGCVSTLQTDRQYYNVYDEQGKRKGYIKSNGKNFIFYDEKWKRKGHIKSD